MKRAKISAKSVQILFSEQQMAEKRPNGCGAIARNRNPLMICAKKTAAITITIITMTTIISITTITTLTLLIITMIDTHDSDNKNDFLQLRFKICVTFVRWFSMLARPAGKFSPLLIPKLKSTFDYDYMPRNDCTFTTPDIHHKNCLAIKGFKIGGTKMQMVAFKVEYFFLFLKLNVFKVQLPIYFFYWWQFVWKTLMKFNESQCARSAIQNAPISTGKFFSKDKSCTFFEFTMRTSCHFRCTTFNWKSQYITLSIWFTLYWGSQVSATGKKMTR